jgi:hypothetical protein
MLADIGNQQGCSCYLRTCDEKHDMECDRPEAEADEPALLPEEVH